MYIKLSAFYWLYSHIEAYLRFWNLVKKANFGERGQHPAVKVGCGHQKDAGISGHLGKMIAYER